MDAAATRLTAAVDAAFADQGVLSGAVPGYERRAGQQEMALAVASLIEDGGTLLAEAGTGTGKTLAYLVPAILSGQRLLVSTGSKNLQEQIFLKDVPALREILGVPFTATLMKGRGNYLCLHRWEAYRDTVTNPAEPRLIESGSRLFIPLVDEWLQQTTTGDRAELPDLPDDLPLWKDVAADASTCLGNECPRHADCFVTLMRQRAASSDLVIVNHHLLCADAAVRQSAYGEVIPTCPTVVVDEAHQLEDVATQYFGISVSTFRVDELVRDAQRLAGRLPARLASDVAESLAHVGESARQFFVALSSMPDGSEGRRTAGDVRARYTADALAPAHEAGIDLVSALDGVEALLTPASSTVDDDGTAPAAVVSGPVDRESLEAAAAIGRRAGDMKQDLRRLLRADDPDFVFFIETRGRGLFLNASPIDVSRLVRDTVLERFRSVVLTSATLTVDRSFDHIRRRLGVEATRELMVPSEFDYANQALVYLPKRLPAPKAPGFAAAAGRETIELLTRSRGRAFVLFTSYAMLRSIEALLRMTLPYPIFAQGSAPRSLLVDQFRRTPNAVLLGTSSFWQGVDVVGDALSCVIIDKLPFASPADPVTAARIDAIRTAGGDPFADYQVPLAILTLQQGLGRLIRHRQDRGVLAILDPRLRTMGYGRRFLASLPPAPVTHDLDAVARFFR